MKDEGMINGVSVLSCFEENGHVYHQTARPIKGQEVELWVDEAHRYISKQGHTAQHLLSAAFYELCKVPTVSHHYNLEGSYIDLDVQDIEDKYIQMAEIWVNRKIREHHDIEILYPTQEELANMPIHHNIKVDKDIRIVHIKEVEYNPCKGMHVLNTSEVQCLYVLGKEHIKGITRIHYMFGEVAKAHFDTYYHQLKSISAVVSKPMDESAEGVFKLKLSKEQVERELSVLQNEYINLYVKAFENQTWMIHECELEGDLLNKLCIKLAEMKNLQCYLFTNKQVITISGENTEKNAKEMFDELKARFDMRGGGNLKICRGTSGNLEKIKEFVGTLKND